MDYLLFHQTERMNSIEASCFMTYLKKCDATFIRGREQRDRCFWFEMKVITSNQFSGKKTALSNWYLGQTP